MQLAGTKGGLLSTAPISFFKKQFTKSYQTNFLNLFNLISSYVDGKKAN